MSALDILIGSNDLIDHLRESLLIHGGDIIESGAVLIDVGTDPRALSRNRSVILHDKEVSSLQLIGISSPLKVPDVRTGDEILSLNS